jgi:hypothetical protein
VLESVFPEWIFAGKGVFKMRDFSSTAVIAHTAVLAGFILFAISLAQAQPDSCTPHWSCVRQVSFDSASSITPRVLSTGDTVHLFWYNQYDFGPSDGNYYRRSTDGGETFSVPFQIVQGESTAGNGSYAVWDKNLYMTYVALVDTPEFVAVGFLRSTDAGETWEPRQLFPEWLPYSMAARESLIYIYFVYNDGVYNRGGLLRSNDYGVTWDSIGRVPYTGLETRLFITPQALHLLMPKSIFSGVSEVLYYRSTDGGESFPIPETLSTHDGITSDQMRIAGDGNGNLFVVWRDGKYGSIDGYHASSLLRKSTDDGISWQAEELLTYTPTAIRPNISYADSKLVIAWNEYVDEYHDRSMVRVSYDRGTTWCDTVGGDINAGEMTASLSTSVLHTAWWTNPNMMLFGDEEIFYRSGSLTDYPQPVASDTVIILPKWNLVSLPLTVTDPRKTTLFPDAISAAYSFENNAYVQAEMLEYGKGYWLKFPSADTIIFQGCIPLNDTIIVSEGWNLIGSFPYDIPVSEISTNPGNLFQSSFFEYDNGYRAVDTLQAGKGYWIKANGNGTCFPTMDFRRKRY